MKSRYIDLTNDYGFKIVFANPEHPDLLLGLLNAIIPDRHFVDITFLNPEVLGPDEDGKRQSYDVRCSDANGNQFIVEMQKEFHKSFPDRMCAYSGDPLSRLYKRGEDYSAIKEVYVIAILGEYLKTKTKGAEKKSLVRRGRVVMEDNGDVLTDKVNYLFLQLPVVRNLKPEYSFLENWAYCIKHMSSLDNKPSGLEGEYFTKLFAASDRHNIAEKNLSIYDKMVREDWVIREQIENAREDAREEGHTAGLEEGQKRKAIETATSMKADGMPNESIAKYTGLSIEEVEAL